MPGARMNSPCARSRRNSAALGLPTMSRPRRLFGRLYQDGRRRRAATADGRATLSSAVPFADQTETGFSSDEPADLQKVVVSVVVWPFLVAVSSIGRQVLPSARV